MGSTPAAGTVLATRPTSFVIDFNTAYRPSSINASDFVVNGLAANSYTLTDVDTVTFQFNTSPVTASADHADRRRVDPRSGWEPDLGLAGDVLLRPDDDDGNVDQPGQGQTVPPPTQIILNFNEAVSTASVGIDDLNLSSGTVTSATVVDADTVSYTVTGLVRYGQVSYTLRPGTLTDAFGTPFSGYSGSFIIDNPNIIRYISTDTPRELTPYFYTTTSTLTINNPDTIVDVDVELEITYPTDFWLTAALIAPDGTPIDLIDNIVDSGANFTGTILDDDAATPISSGAPFTGRYQPSGSLAVLDGRRTRGSGPWRSRRGPMPACSTPGASWSSVSPRSSNHRFSRRLPIRPRPRARPSTSPSRPPIPTTAP